MIALTCSRPGLMEYTDVAMPNASPGRAVIKIRRVGICGTDLHGFEGTQPFFSYPRIMGHEIAGELLSSDSADGFNEGELVTIIPYYSCGSCIACRNGTPNCCTAVKVCGVHIDGGMVEYLSVPTSQLIHGGGLPADSIALVEPLAIGAHAVRRAAIRPGEFVLVIGAGPIGMGTMESARIAGAKVIAMDVNEQRLQFCREELQVAYTIDGREGNTIAQLRSITSNEMPTVVFDATGNRKAIQNGFAYLAHGGRYVLIGLQKETLSFSHPEFHKREATLMSSRNATRADFENVLTALENGWINPQHYITHRIKFGQLAGKFSQLTDPANRVIKAMVEVAD